MRTLSEIPRHEGRVDAYLAPSGQPNKRSTSSPDLVSLGEDESSSPSRRSTTGGEAPPLRLPAASEASLCKCIRVRVSMLSTLTVSCFNGQQVLLLAKPSDALVSIGLSLLVLLASCSNDCSAPASAERLACLSACLPTVRIVDAGWPATIRPEGKQFAAAIYSERSMV